VSKEKAQIQEELYDVAVSCIVDLDEQERGNISDPRLRNRSDYVSD